MAADSPLYKHISEVGLDNTSYWMSKLADIGVQSLASLHHIEGDEKVYNQLAEKVKFMIEIKALKKLLKINQSIVASLPPKKSKIEVLLNEIMIWNKKQNNLQEQVEERLESLVKAKHAIIHNEGLSISAWIDVLSSDEVQKYLKKIMLGKFNSSLNIKLYMEEIIDHIDDDNMTKQASPLIKSIFSWLHDLFNIKNISDFSHFNEFLKIILANEKWIKTSKTSKLNTPEALRKYVSEAFYYFRLHYKKTYEDVFILIIIHPWKILKMM